MPFEAWLTVAVVGAVFLSLAMDRVPAEFAVAGGLGVLLVAGVLTPQAGFAGFSNPGVIALAGLYVITGALRETGALDRPAHRLLAGAPDVASARRRLTLVTTPLSAVLNNTPIVALFMPLATAWAARHRVSAGALLMPLSFAAVLGGTVTLIGTSTHLIVHGLLLESGQPGFGLFELTPVGLPVAVIGLLALWPLSSRLLRGEANETPLERPRREYLSELRVTADGPIAGQTVEQAGLRQLAGLFLVRVVREGRIIAPVGPQEVLAPGDRLTFAGLRETIVELRRRRGLVVAGAEDHDSADWTLHEAVISRSSPLVGTSVRDANFRGTYQAAVLAVHRHGEHIERKIGDIVLRPGDTLLLQAVPGFERVFRDAPDFYLINTLSDATRPRHAKAPLAIGLLVAVMTCTALGVLELPTAALVGALAVVASGCLSAGAARRSVDMMVLLVIACALGLARALEETGVAAAMAKGVIGVAEPLGPVGLLIGVYLAGTLLTELVTNTAAAALVFPVAMAVAAQAGLDPRPFAVATSISASISLATPLGYQTNMMVFGPGGYRFRDFLRLGLPLQLICATVALTALTLVYDL